ncbi:MAG: MBL fold metallo-hydrolase [Candidatus Bipolaricaulota bacterium]
MSLTVYSKALYATWVYYSPDRVLFDCGEGASSHLENKSFAIRRVFLSHGHADHISGLMGLINIRNNAMGDREKELQVYFPAGNHYISELMTYFSRTNRRLRYHLEWIPLTPGDRVPMLGGRNPRHVEAFPTLHASGETTLGYNVLERRQRLKEECQDLSQEEIVAFVKAGRRDEISEVYDQKLLSYGGDSVPLRPGPIHGTEVLLHDTTFVADEDRKEFKHSTLDEALEAAQAAGVQRKLVCLHISSRYRRDLKRVERRLQRMELPFDVVLIPPGDVVDVEL